MFVVAMFADVVVVVIAPDAMSVVVPACSDADVTELTVEQVVTVETVVSVPDAIVVAFVAPRGAEYAQEVAGVARRTVVIVPEVYAVAVART